MWEPLRRALVDPGSFVSEGEATPRRTAALLAAAVVVCLLPAPLKVAAFRSDAVDWDVIGSYPQFVYAARDASVGVPGLYGALLVVGLLVPPLAVAIYAGFFHALSWPIASEGSYRETAVVTVWGLLPLTAAGAIALAVCYAAFGVFGPRPVVVGVNFPARVVVAPLSLDSPWLLLDLFVSASLLWTGYVWTKGLAAARDLSTRQAVAVVALPLGWTLLTTIGVQMAIRWLVGAL